MAVCELRRRRARTVRTALMCLVVCENWRVASRDGRDTYRRAFHTELVWNVNEFFFMTLCVYIYICFHSALWSVNLSSSMSKYICKFLE